jgi:hypothetical protein
MAHAHGDEQGFELGVQVSSSRGSLGGARFFSWSDVETTLETRQ